LTTFNLATIEQHRQAFVANIAQDVLAEAERLKASRIANDKRVADKITLDELTDPGGLISDLVDWITSSAERPSRALALSAVIPFVGALAGRRFASPTNLRTNFYCIALASSGYGKEHARSQLKLLVTAAGLDKFTGPSRFMSASALRKSVMANPSCVCMVDEFGGLLRQINDKKAGLHNQLIRGDLLEMFSSAGSYFEGAAYADNVTPEKVHHPNLNLYGTSTPEDFWASVTSLNSADGLLPRFMLFGIDGAKPKEVTPERSVRDVPETLAKACQALATAGGVGNLSIMNAGNAPCRPMVVPYTPDAEAELKRLKRFIEEQSETAEPKSQPILNRAVEHAIKLALVVSVAANPKRPAITGPQMEWATKLAWHSTAAMVQETGNRIADSQREADLNRVYDAIKRAGKEGITDGRIGNNCRGIDRKRRAELLQDLVDAGRVVPRITTDTGGRPRSRYYVA
jgi:hypothetical protein